MARPKGAPNKYPNKIPATLKLTSEDRTAFLANLIVDAIEEDKKNGLTLLNKLVRGK